MTAKALAAALVISGIIALSTVSGGAQTTGPATPPAPVPPGNAEKGRTLFVKTGCAQCHGREAQGSPTTGPRLGPGGMPYAAFARYVREPRAQMPPYTDKVLSDAEMADIYRFAQSRPKPPAPKLLQP